MSESEAHEAEPRKSKDQRVEEALTRLKVLPDQKTRIHFIARTITQIGRSAKVNESLFKPKGRAAADAQLGDLAQSIGKVKKIVDALSRPAVAAIADLGLMRFDLVEAVVASEHNLHRIIEVVRHARSSLPPMVDPPGGNDRHKQAETLAKYVAKAYEQLTGRFAPRSRNTSVGSRDIDKDGVKKDAAYGQLMKEVFGILRPGGSKAYDHPALEAAKWLHEQRQRVLRLRRLRRVHLGIGARLKKKKLLGRAKIGKKRQG